MIKTNKGEIQIVGNLKEVFADLALAIESVHNFAEQALGKEAADMLIVKVGRIAFMSAEELKDAAGHAKREEQQ